MNVNGNYTQSMSAINSDNTKVRPKKEGEEVEKAGGKSEGAAAPPPPKTDTYESGSFVPTEDTIAATKQSSSDLASAVATLEDSAEETTEEVAKETTSFGSDYTNISDDERMKLVDNLKKEQLKVDAQFMQKLQGMYSETLSGMGYLEITPEIQAEAQEAISADGYWGVDKTSERLFDFAMALAGDDPEVMAEMRTAFEKGFEAAEKSWGGELPEIAYETKEATLAKFDEWEANYNALTGA